jgi:WD40 repeat protein
MANFSSSRKRSASLAGGLVALLTAFSGTAIAGPTGAVGDIYVIGATDLGFGFESPAVLQYDGQTGELVGSFASRVGGQFNGMTWGTNGNLFTSWQGSFGRWRIREFNGQTGEFIQDVVTYNVGDFSAGKGLTFGADGDLYVGDWAKGTINRYDGTTFALKTSTTAGGIGTPNGMRFAPDGHLMVISGGSNQVREYDVSGGGIADAGVFATITGSIQAQDLTFGPNGNLFVARGAAGGVAEFDGVTGASLGEFVGGDSSLPVNGLAFDNYNRLLVSDIFPISRVDAYDAVTGAALGPFLTDGFGDIGVGLSIPTIITIKTVPAPGAFSLLMLTGMLGSRRRR